MTASAARKLVVFVSLCILFLIGVGGVCILLSWKPVAEPLRAAIEYMPPVSKIFVFVLFAILPLIALFFWARGGAKKGVITSETQDGVIHISESAITKCIRNALRTMPNVLNVQVSLKSTPRGIRTKVRAEVKISAGGLPQLNRRMKETVMDTLTRVLGISNVEDVRILISDIKVGGEESLQRPETPPPDISLESQV